MPRGNQLTRQWQLLQLIERAEGVVVEDAARELACTVRTIWRDLKVLQEAGFPVYDERAADGRRSVWRISDEFRRSLPLKLSLPELTALIMSRDLLAPGVDAGFGRSLRGAFAKIGGVLSRDARALVDRMREVVGVRAFGAKLHAPAAEHIDEIHRALLERRQLDLRYYSMSRDDVTARRVDPYHLTYAGGGFYLVAHCHLREAPRIFAVERIRALRTLAGRFTLPAAFDAERYLNGAWGILRGDVVTVRVLFARTLARYIAERLWHPTQQLRTLPDGRLEMTLRVADTLEVRRWILGYGTEAEVVEPAALREAIRREAEALASKLLPGRRSPVAVGPGEAAHRHERRGGASS